MHAASLPAPAVFLKRTRAPASRLPPGVVIGVRSAPPGRVPPSSSLPQRPVRSPGSRTPDARRRAARKDGAGCVDAHQEPSTLILFWRHRLAVSPQCLSRPPWQVGLQAAAPEGGRERPPSFPTPARPPLAPPPPSAASRSHFRVSLHTRPCARARGGRARGETHLSSSSSPSSVRARLPAPSRPRPAMSLRPGKDGRQCPPGPQGPLRMGTCPESVTLFLFAVGVAIGGALVDFCHANHPSDTHGGCGNREDGALEGRGRRGP